MKIAALYIKVVGFKNSYDNFIRFDVKDILEKVNSYERGNTLIFEHEKSIFSTGLETIIPYQEGWVFCELFGKKAAETSGVHKNRHYIILEENLFDTIDFPETVALKVIDNKKERADVKNFLIPKDLIAPEKRDDASYIESLENHIGENGFIVLYPTKNSMFYFAVSDYQTLLKCHQGKVHPSDIEKCTSMNEVIRKNCKIKLYFDIDLKIDYCSAMDDILVYFMQYVNNYLIAQFSKKTAFVEVNGKKGEPVKKKRRINDTNKCSLDTLTINDWFLLKSSDDKKYSAHLVLSKPGVFFANIEHLKVFIKTLEKNILSESSQSTISKLFTVPDKNGRKVMFDTAVYRSGGGFRMLGAIKKNEPSRPFVTSYKTGSIAHPSLEDSVVFYSTLLHNIPEKHEHSGLVSFLSGTQETIQPPSSEFGENSKKETSSTSREEVIVKNDKLSTKHGVEPGLCDWVALCCREKKGCTVIPESQDIFSKIQLVESKQQKCLIYCATLRNQKHCPISGEIHSSDSLYLVLSITREEGGTHTVALACKCRKNSCTNKVFRIFNSTGVDMQKLVKTQLFK